MTNIKKRPLVGILAGKHKDKRFSGDHEFFQSIAKALKKKGGQAFIFTLADIKDETITGYMYDNGWRKDKFLYPDIVYNRLPTSRQEQSKRARQFFNVLSN